MDISVGTDIVTIDRIAALIRDHGDRFLGRWFTAEETVYCRSKALPAQHFAARYAAKEAVAKALRSRWDGGIPWCDIEVVSGPEGAPAIRLSGEPAQRAQALGVSTIRVSLSHCREFATATAVLLLPDTGTL